MYVTCWDCSAVGLLRFLFGDVLFGSGGRKRGTVDAHSWRVVILVFSISCKGG